MISDYVINILCLLMPVIICSLVTLWRYPNLDESARRRELLAIFIVCVFVYVVLYTLTGFNI